MIDAGGATFFRDVLERSGVALCIFQKCGKRVFVNKRFCELVGKSEEELIPGRIGDTLIADDRAKVEAAFRKCMSSGQSLSDFTVRWVLGDDVKYASANWVPILDQGNQEVALCERGIRSFESHTRFTLPLATVPYLRQRTHLPIVIDPSHGTGIASLVPPMCTAAVAAGADGLIIEVHPDPKNAMSDGAQSLTPEAFEKTMVQCRKVAHALELNM